MSKIKVADEKQLKAEILKCIKFYENFHEGRAVDKQYTAKHIRLDPTDVLMDLGYLRGVVYETVIGQVGEPGFWFHPFDKPFPVLSTLAVTKTSGKGLFIVGGKFTVTPRGVVG